jgi:5-methyltetrahydrofolate--homocysteine methyltransferase
MEEQLNEIMALVVDGKHDLIEEKVKQAIDGGVDLDRLINDSLIAAMDIVGKRFSESVIFVPEMLVSAMTMKKGLQMVKPLLSGNGDNARGTVLLGTVKGDLHDIGKNLVAMMLEGAGYKIIDMGVDIKVEDVVASVADEKADVLGMSALLTTTLPAMGQVIEALKEAGLRDKVKVMVGGAPVDSAFAEKIGADGYAADAAEAVELTRQLMAG